MEKLLHFQEQLKNKMKDTLRYDLESAISKKENEINNIKDKYENQTHKEGFFLKTHYNDCKNNYTSKSSFFIIVFVFLFLSVFNIFFYASLNGNEEADFGVYVFSFMVFSFIPFMVFYLAVFESYYFETYQSKNFFHLKTHLTMIYEKHSKELSSLKNKLSTLDDGLNEYIKEKHPQNTNFDDIQEIAKNTSINKEELNEMSNILNKEDLIYLSMEATIRERKTLNLSYDQVLNFLRFKRRHQTENIASLMFNKNTL